MKKLFLLLTMAGTLAYAQDEAPAVDSTRNWVIEGQHSLMLNQAAFSNWVGGGANNVGWIASVNYNLAYEKDKNLWENIINLAYGQNNTKGVGQRKTQDVLNLSTNYGRKIGNGNWYASAGASLQSQFAAGYEDGNNPSEAKISSFMAPGYLNLGAGFTYRPNDNFTMTLRPANARWTFVLDKDLQQAGNFGLKKDGDASLFQFGFSGTAVYKVQLMENISLINSASVFSNYLDHPERLVLSYGGILNMKVNKYISTLLTVDLMYDHNQLKRTQLKQTLGVGIAYNFTKGVRKSKDTNHQSWK